MTLWLFLHRVADFPWTDEAETLRFDAFMGAALHDPRRGYYARRIRGVGARGDFTTTAELAPALGKAVASWAGEAMRETGARDLIELGPGEGALVAAVRRHLPWRRRWRLKFHLVESSAPLRERQRHRLGGAVRWHESVEAALDAAKGVACLYSNEFVDAFPVRRFRRSAEGWEESFVLPGRELWKAATDLPDSSVFDHTWPLGQVVEVHESYHHWLRDMLPAWRAGRMLTIDYGADSRSLYHRRPGGSLRGYLHQQRIEGPAVMENPGRQDITADVNFTDLEKWPADLLATVRRCDQTDFLGPFVDPGHPADRYAIDPHGPGGAFLCLDQRRV